ncbi:response regulator [Sandarakinorhabdus sp.]|uniref:response regulator n=1 Tax=Sandarakinorhabdus sp. TaxID=1916663 RepID=UPI00333FCD03
MPKTKVLVVDDSFSMRALYTTALESSPEIEVIGNAASAAEARKLIAECRPNVMTLDIEMPGMNGIDFLEEVMATTPMPVIMVSSHTQEGAETTLRARALGAAACVPKLRSATPEETARNYASLCEVVLNAANAPVPTPLAEMATADIRPLMVIASGELRPAMGAVLLLAADIPPTILLARTDRNPAALLALLANVAVPRVVLATDGMVLAAGTVHVVADPDLHAIVDTWPGGTIRLIDRPPIAGVRPSADLLLASVAKAAGAAASVNLLPGLDADGEAGVQAIRAAGGAAQTASLAAA